MALMTVSAGCPRIPAPPNADIDRSFLYVGLGANCDVVASPRQVRFSCDSYRKSDVATLRIMEWSGRGLRISTSSATAVLNEFYRVAFRKKVYRSIDELQADLDFLDRGIQSGTATSGTVVLRENPNADLPGRNADSEGENDRSLTTSDTKTRPLNQVSAVRSSSC